MIDVKKERLEVIYKKSLFIMLDFVFFTTEQNQAL